MKDTNREDEPLKKTNHIRGKGPRTETVRIHGNCLENLGIPDKGWVVIDREATPQVFDLVWCSGVVGGEIGGFLKEMLRDGSRPIVGTNYKDGKKNYCFSPAEIYGVALRVMDEKRIVVWERPWPPEIDALPNDRGKRDQKIRIEEETMLGWDCEAKFYEGMERVQALKNSDSDRAEKALRLFEKIIKQMTEKLREERGC